MSAASNSGRSLATTLPLDERGPALPCSGSPRLGDARLVCAGRQLNLAVHSFKARHAAIAAVGSGGGIGIWAFLAAFAVTAAGYMGIPFTGTAAIGAAAVLASQGQLNIAAVLIVAAIGNEAGGLLGCQAGDRWAGSSWNTRCPPRRCGRRPPPRGRISARSGDAPPCH